MVTEPVLGSAGLQCSCPPLRMYTAWAKMEECLVCKCYPRHLVQNGENVTSNFQTHTDMVMMRFAAAHPLHGLSGRWKKQLN